MHTANPAHPASPTRPASAPSSRLSRWLNSAPVAYLLLILLQLGVVWGMWDRKDTTFGDTSSYFLDAYRWPEEFTVNIAWSPLYTSFFGSFLFLTADPSQAVLWHRLVIVFAASILVLAVMRRLLPPGWAWLMAAWWAILPINFNTMYEIHLFAVLPLLTVWLLLSGAGRWARGSALALLTASTILVRNEMSVAVVLLAVCCLISEWRRWRRAKSPRRSEWRGILACYGVPLSLALGVCFFAYQRSRYQYPVLSEVVDQKHRLNMAQVYATGYQQRHPEWTHCPMTGYQDLVTAHFGKPEPSLREMFAYNPRGVIEHFAWNLGMTPNGCQVLLFNATSGRTNPDYFAVQLRQKWVRIPTALLLGCWLAGLVTLVRQRRFWWRAWLKQRRFIWLGMLAVVAVAPLVICTQRPRPSYLFGLSVFLMACTGMALFILTRRFRLQRKLPLLVPTFMAVVVATVWLFPSTFAFYRQLPPERPLHTRLHRLQPYQSLYRSPDTVIIQGDFAYEIASYLGRGRCHSQEYTQLKQDWQPGVPLEEYLAEHNVTAIYFDEALLTWVESERLEEVQGLLGAQPPPGWKLLASGETPGDRWLLFQRSASTVKTTNTTRSQP